MCDPPKYHIILLGCEAIISRFNVYADLAHIIGSFVGATVDIQPP